MSWLPLAIGTSSTPTTGTCSSAVARPPEPLGGSDPSPLRRSDARAGPMMLRGDFKHSVKGS
eukprot:5651578-Pyramimonas_sp.AAC.1